jgi:hypothetical protein
MQVRVVAGWRRWLIAAAVAVLAVMVAAPVPAWADDLPPLTGLTVPEAEKTLQAWNQAVEIDFVPALTDLPPNLDPALVLVAGAVQIHNPKVDAANIPLVEVDLGARVPDLTGLTLSGVNQALGPLEMKSESREADPDWVVQLQRPAAGEVARFGSVIFVLLAPPLVTTPPPTSAPPPPPTTSAPIAEPTTRFDPTLVAAVAGGGLLGLLLLAALATTAVRRGRRARRPVPTERVEAYGYPGVTAPPELVELAAPVSVRLEPRHSPATITVDEGDA